MKRDILFIFLFFVFLLPVVSGLAEKVGSDVDIRHAVRLDGAIPSSPSCNLTVYSPNNSVIVDYKEMTDGGDEFNYTINNTLLSSKGKYEYDVTCCTGTHCGTETFDFFINPGGVEPTDQRTGALTRSIWIIFILGVVLFIAFLFIQSIPIKSTVFLVALLFILAGINLVFVSLEDEVVNPKLEAFFSGFTAISFYVYYFIFFLIAVIWIITIINEIVGRQNAAAARRFGNIQ